MIQMGARVLVTGATGFVGRRLCQRIINDGGQVCRATRSLHHLADEVQVGEINNETDWTKALKRVDCVVHLAARVHIVNEKSKNALAEFRRVNVDGTLNLARQAADADVRRFIFISSIKVNGEESRPGHPFTENDKPSPQDDYAITKWEAEQGLLKLSEEREMDVVIIRPPLVYGPGVKANFRTLMCWLTKGIPLPFKSASNKRSLVSLDNLVDLIVTCIDHSAARNQVFLASDGRDLSTSELLQLLGGSLGKPAKLFPVPEWLLKTSLSLIGKHKVAVRLCGSLQADIIKARTLLDWKPPQDVEKAMMATARDFLDSGVAKP